MVDLISEFASQISNLIENSFSVRPGRVTIFLLSVVQKLEGVSFVLVSH